MSNPAPQYHSVVENLPPGTASRVVWERIMDTVPHLKQRFTQIEEVSDLEGYSTLGDLCEANQKEYGETLKNSTHKIPARFTGIINALLGNPWQRDNNCPPSAGLGLSHIRGRVGGAVAARHASPAGAPPLPASR